MRKRLSSLLTLAVFACSWSSFVPTAEAGSFVVPTRDDVLIKTSQIQATQFLTHATFGGTEQEINDLALRMRQIGRLRLLPSGYLINRTIFRWRVMSRSTAISRLPSK